MGFPVRVIRRDRVPRCGPLGGVYTALATTQSEAVLFLPCDMPFLGTEAVRCVLEKYIPQSHAVFTRHGNRVGFPFVLNRRAIEKVARQVERGEFSLQALARFLRARIIRVPRKFAPQLRNVNTRSDWETAKRLWNRRNCKR
jgi:molybdopterin-guanine dinucleotide biosynthesis protein A